MPILEKLESFASRYKRLMEDMIALNGQECPPLITPEWVKRAQDVLNRSSQLMADPGFAAVKSTPQIHQYRIELLRLKATLESGQQLLLSQRKTIQADRARLKRVGALTATLRSMQ
jgi:hypothetical protein